MTWNGLCNVFWRGHQLCYSASLRELKVKETICVQAKGGEMLRQTSGSTSADIEDLLAEERLCCVIKGKVKCTIFDLLHHL